MIEVAGHFGEWLQGRLGQGGPVALVTMICTALSVRLLPGDSTLVQCPEVLGEARLGRLAAALGKPVPGGRLEADMPPGGGAGASTAALVALARAAGCRDAEIAAICHAVEGASDPLMLEAPDSALWAPREARRLETLPPPPRARIVGGFFGPPCPTDPADHDFPDIGDLVAEWRMAPTLRIAARLAGLSAERSTALRGPAGDRTAEIAAETGALGHLRAHTGSARGLIFAPGAQTDEAERALARAGASSVVVFDTGSRP
ncbi:biphenyl 2,3-dioxygenase [Roseivivax halodurans JCM 10272]|uniref:Biphenyl 2,3-dioxygenase n=1 Tax=Roseivivax halodurans JCM 10272 TaxID=1449350 RepID=X7ECR5_9RHOB|nr:hypothetical protein [Roseivivax halodurans]ETX13690.1 biphenyl 2,3-dioxygenase [Roseivivax halodurans JCM 10272]